MIHFRLPLSLQNKLTKEIDTTINAKALMLSDISINPIIFRKKEKIKSATPP